MKKLLFIHGYNGSPYGNSYNLLNDAIDHSKYELFTIDYDAADPERSLEEIMAYVKSNGINMIIGTSLGGFLALNCWSFPRIVHNPCMRPSEELPKIGMDLSDASKYKHFEDMFDDYADMEERLIVSAVFASDDELLAKDNKAVYSRRLANEYIIPGKHFMDKTSAEAIASVIGPFFEQMREDTYKTSITRP